MTTETLPRENEKTAPKPLQGQDPESVFRKQINNGRQLGRDRGLARKKGEKGVWEWIELKRTRKLFTKRDKQRL